MGFQSTEQLEKASKASVMANPRTRTQPNPIRNSHIDRQNRIENREIPEDLKILKVARKLEEAVIGGRHG